MVLNESGVVDRRYYYLKALVANCGKVEALREQTHRCRLARWEGPRLSRLAMISGHGVLKNGQVLGPRDPTLRT